MLERGSWTIARPRGIPIRLHWTLPLGAFVFSGFRFSPGFWLGFVLLVLAHELGHAALVRWFRLRVVGIDITGFGGLCHWSGMATPLSRGAIAWGGVLAQLLVLGVTLGTFAILGRPRTLFVAELHSVFTTTNLWLMALNLIPVPPLDGAEAWDFVRRILRGERFRRPKGPRAEAHVWQPPRTWSGWRAARKVQPKPATPPPAPKGNGNGHPAAPSKEANEELARLFEKVAKEAGKARR